MPYRGRVPVIVVCIGIRVGKMGIQWGSKGMIRVWGHNRDSINLELLYQIMGED